MKLFARLTIGVAALVTLVANLPFRHHLPVAKRAEFGDGDMLAANCRQCDRSLTSRG